MQATGTFSAEQRYIWCRTEVHLVLDNTSADVQTNLEIDIRKQYASLLHLNHSKIK